MRPYSLSAACLCLAIVVSFFTACNGKFFTGCSGKQPVSSTDSSAGEIDQCVDETHTCEAHETCVRTEPNAFDCIQRSFISRWNTANAGDSNDTQIALPLTPYGTYDFTVDWGDGTSSQITAWDQAETTHTYPQPGAYSVEIRGTIDGWSFGAGGVVTNDAEKIVELSQWGPLKLGNTGNFFRGAKNLEVTATDVLDLTGTTTLARAFEGCESLTTIPRMEDWNVSNVTNMGSMFYVATAFNQDISQWNVSNVTNMEGMFFKAEAFNHDLSQWDVSNVTRMSHMFSGATAFNQDLSQWDVSNVNATDMRGMFSGAEAFNQDLSQWDVSNITDMRWMFSGATAFNQDLSQWDVSNVTTMDSMFGGASRFDQNLSQWDVSNVTKMNSMFRGATAFNQDLSQWDVSNVATMRGMFEDVTLSTSNYDAILNEWSTQPIQNGVRFDAGNSRYSSAAADARRSLFDDHKWITTDGGPEHPVSSTAPNATESCLACEANETCVLTKPDTFECVQRPFISWWNTDKYANISLPLTPDGTYDFTVDWGDGTSSQITAWDQAETTHTYPKPGSYSVEIRGTIEGWSFGQERLSRDRSTWVRFPNYAQNIFEIWQWGSLKLGDTGRYFQEADSLKITATDVLDLTGTATLTHAFKNCGSLTNIPGIEAWNVSNVTNMSGLFSGATAFNQTLSKWDVSNVTDMGWMFSGTTAFNQALSKWDVSNVTNMSGMFYGTKAFNQDLSQWDVSNVTDMSLMFGEAEAFNQDLSQWDVSNVTNMNGMFGGSETFNQDLSQWDVSNVTNIEGMFWNTETFNHDISQWNVSNVTDMSVMFYDAKAFNQDLSQWDVSNVTSMVEMFSGASRFNQDISQWDVSNVTSMTTMFKSAKAFNHDISQWDVSNVTDMSRMFEGATSFNQDLSQWDVSNVTNMSGMFYDAKAFNQDLSKWDVSKVTDMRLMFENVTLSTSNYDAILKGWATQPVQNGVELDAGNSRYSSAAAAARQFLIDDHNWVISDGGPE